MSVGAYPAYKDSGAAWLGAVPASWETNYGRRLFAQRRDPAQIDDEQLSATQKYGVLPQKKFMETEGQKVVLALSGTENFKHVEPDDFVISLRSFQGGIERSTYRGCVSPAYTVLRPTRKMSPRYWEFLLKCDPLIAALQTMSDGIRDGKTISYDQFGNVALPVPAPAEQSAIAAFLDRETGKIDALVAEQERLMALLKEKRQAVISQAVTKGLNPNAKMKPSGVEWLGEVPEHWDVVALKHIVADIKAGPFGSSLTKDMYVQAGYRVYGQEQVISDDFSIGDYFISPEQFLDMRQYEVHPGDILVSCVGTFGRISVVPQNVAPGIINPRLLRLRASPVADPYYLAITLRSEVVFEQFSMYSRGGTMDVINIGTLSNILIALPPIVEQVSIMRYLAEQMDEIDALSEQAAVATALLKERRAALISAAVTGKIDVRGLTDTQQDAA